MNDRHQHNQSGGQHGVGVLLLLLAVAGLWLLPQLPAQVRGATALPLEQALPSLARKRVILLFAGFPACSQLCPDTLARLATLMPRIADPLFTVVFLNLQLHSAERISQRYAQSFHPQFLGTTLRDEQQRLYQRGLGLRGGTQMSVLARHRGWVYLLQRQSDGWQLQQAFASAEDLEAITEQLQRVLASASEGVTHV